MIRIAACGLAFFLICFAQGSQKGKQIAWVGQVLIGADVFWDKFARQPEETLTGSTKVVVLSRTEEWTRIIRSNGLDGFVKSDDIVVGDPVTLQNAISKVKYFEKLEIQNPLDEERYRELGAPWVHLVVRELNKRKSQRLPPLSESYTQNDLQEPKLTVDNETQYTLTVYLSGPKAKAFSIAPRGSRVWELPSGSYRVVATCSNPSVRQLNSTWNLKQGYEHSIRLFIKTYRVRR